MQIAKVNPILLHNAHTVFIILLHVYIFYMCVYLFNIYIYIKNLAFPFSHKLLICKALKYLSVKDKAVDIQISLT